VQRKTLPKTTYLECWVGDGIAGLGGKRTSQNSTNSEANSVHGITTIQSKLGSAREGSVQGGGSKTTRTGGHQGHNGKGCNSDHLFRILKGISGLVLKVKGITISKTFNNLSKLVSSSERRTGIKGRRCSDDGSTVRKNDDFSPFFRSSLELNL